MAEDLARRVRDYARGPGRAGVAVSSAWLVRELDVDPRTIAAALRRYGIRPAEVERGVRGYLIAELAGLDLGDEPDQPAEVAPVPLADVGLSAVDRLSAALGHRVEPVLRAAGLL